MSRKWVGIVFSLCLLVVPAVAADHDRDVDVKDLKGVPHKHRYIWSVAGGTALGAGLGAFGGPVGAGKGSIIGGSVASAFYLSRHHQTGGGWRPWLLVATNGALLGGLGWTVCDCGDGMGIGALIGGGGTAVIQAFGTRHKTLAQATGANQPPPPQNNPSGNTPPPQPPPDNNRQQPNNNQPQNNNQTPNNLPDSPEPHNLSDMTDPQ